MSRANLSLSLDVGDETISADPDKPIDLSIPLLFNGEQPRFFGAPDARSKDLAAGDWVGNTRHGGSCNVQTYELTPHCNGTHTECIGHIVHDDICVGDMPGLGLLPATLITINPMTHARTRETSLPNPAPNDRMITAYAIKEALEEHDHERMRHALIIRTLPNSDHKAVQEYHADDPPPFLSMEAASLLVDLGVEHILLDVPSLDRMADGGRLSAHHIFFGLPPGERSAKAADRAHCTVTEMIYVPDVVPDGYYLLNLQLPPFMTDAAPSRPIIYQAVIS
ncbi:MAG: cyclase family protein [Gammaproteobacteria bacterium]|nr:cyclase family protein [Gammaproteobacteria bacterium]